ncbi:MAG: hypothetical protein JWN61_2093 [Pseudonocardiales bacterium]|nr:hypothetical protein [Jatrophihabitantaceae bacterium]MCW2603958.1 hypothetical protein [Pseudonocardiales bacterium]
MWRPPAHSVRSRLLGLAGLATALAACTSGGGTAPAPSSADTTMTAPAPSASATNAALAPGTRWWAVPGAPAGSTVDPGDPRSVAESLTADAQAYCAVLAATAAYGTGLLGAAPSQTLAPGSGPTAPGDEAVAQAWLAELQALAPTADLRAAWVVLAAAVTAGADPAAVAQLGPATDLIAGQAAAACGVSLG